MVPMVAGYVHGRWLEKRMVPTRKYPRKYITTDRATSVSSFSWELDYINISETLVP
jgi:hypothetical protein